MVASQASKPTTLKRTEKTFPNTIDFEASDKINKKPKDNSTLELVDLEQIYEELCDDDSTSVKPEFKKILDIKKFQAINGQKLAIQIIIQFHDKYPELIDDIVKAIQFCINSHDSELRKTTYATLRQIDEDSIIFDEVLIILIRHFPNILDENEDKLFTNTLNFHLNRYPIKSLNLLFTMMESFNGQKLMKILKLCTKFELKNPGIISTNEEINDKMINACEKIISGKDYAMMIPALELLLRLPTMCNLKIRLDLIKRFKLALHISKPYTLKSIEDKQRIKNTFDILNCVDKLFSKNANSDVFFDHLLTKLLPFFDSMKNEKKIDYLTHVLKFLYNFASNLHEISPKNLNLFLKYLKDFLPSVPIMDENNLEDPNLQLSLIEPLFFILYELMLKDKSINHIIKKDQMFIPQLLYVARINQNSMARVKSYFEQSDSIDFENMQNKTCTIGFVISQNIQMIIKDLLRSVPLCNLVIMPSWKMPYDDMILSVSRLIKFSNLSKHQINEPKDFKKERNLYTPPVGKYSRPSNNHQQVTKTKTVKVLRNKSNN